MKLTCQLSESHLQTEKQLLLKRISVEGKVHDKTMAFLTWQRGTLETSIQEWMVKYEVDTEQKAVELETLKQQRAADLDRFEELVASYESLERTVDEERIAWQAEAEEARVAANRLAAALVIQTWYKKFRLVKNQKQAASKAAKKAGGKKKKGKK